MLKELVSLKGTQNVTWHIDSQAKSYMSCTLIENITCHIIIFSKISLHGNRFRFQEWEQLRENSGTRISLFSIQKSGIFDDYELLTDAADNHRKRKRYLNFEEELKKVSMKLGGLLLVGGVESEGKSQETAKNCKPEAAASSEELEKKMKKEEKAREKELKKLKAAQKAEAAKQLTLFCLFI
ncbi:hypothetical protein HAX54_002969, partial [Datura stramonium]|nr:hypothetical protein [Datura stramonium]